MDNVVNCKSYSNPPTLKDPEKVKAVHSEPWQKPTLSHRPNVQHMQTLEECIQFLTELAIEVKDISEGKNKVIKKKNKNGKVSLSGSMKSPVIKWVENSNILAGGSISKHSMSKGTTLKDVSESASEQERILMWSRELQSVSERFCLTEKDLKDLRQVLTNHGVKQKKLACLLPFLEFVVWSLHSYNANEEISEKWLTTKQKAWKIGRQKYIPNSVWHWIKSTSVPIYLDPSTSHPWIHISEDKLEMHEEQIRREPQENHQQFDTVAGVLGHDSFSSGRHYWEVDVPKHGGWSLGVMTASAPRKGRLKMFPEAGYWTIWSGPKNIRASTNPPTHLPESLQPNVVGVYLDYQEGQVSFYDVENRFHIYTFTDTFKENVYPVFACLDGKTVIRVRTPALME